MEDKVKADLYKMVAVRMETLAQAREFLEEAIRLCKVALDADEDVDDYLGLSELQKLLTGPMNEALEAIDSVLVEFPETVDSMIKESKET